MGVAPLQWPIRAPRPRGVGRLGDLVVGHAEQHGVGARDRLAAAGRAVHLEPRGGEGAGQGRAQPTGPDD